MFSLPSSLSLLFYFFLFFLNYSRVIAPREQLLRTYHRLAPDLERLRLPEIRITSDNWTEYLGQKR